MSRSVTARASRSLKRAQEAAKGASDSARMLGITGSRTIRMCGFAVRAAPMKARALAAVCSASV